METHKSKVAEETGRVYQLIALLTATESSSQGRVTRKVPIPLEWIRESDNRAIFWGWVEVELAKFDITPKDREAIATRLARVIEPPTKEEAEAVNQDFDRVEYRNAQLQAERLKAQWLVDPTAETEAEYHTALDRVEYLLLRYTENLKKRYQDETKGI
jgi:hypothetical protein